MGSLDERALVHAALGDPHRLRIVDELALGDRSPGELAEMLAISTNLLAHHLDVLAEAGVVSRRASAGDRRRRYVTLRRQAVTDLVPRGHLPGGRVLFVCTRNSARSQLAAALWEKRTGEEAESAGSSPADVVHPLAVRVGAELGVDLGTRRPQGFADVGGEVSLVVTACDRAREDGDPFDVAHLHWSIPDPVEAGTVGAFRGAFADIADRIEALAAANA